MFVVYFVAASNSLAEAESLVSRYPNASALALDILDRERVGRLVEQSDVVIRCVVELLGDFWKLICVAFCRWGITRPLPNSASSIENISSRLRISLPL